MLERPNGPRAGLGSGFCVWRGSADRRFVVGGGLSTGVWYHTGANRHGNLVYNVWPAWPGSTGKLLARARTMPTVRTISRKRHFWAAKTCSTRARIRARVALPRAMCAGILRPRGFLR